MPAPKRKKRKKNRFSPYGRGGNPRKRVSTSISKMCESLICMGIHTEKEQAQAKASQKEKKKKEEEALEILLWKEREKALALLKKSS